MSKISRSTIAASSLTEASRKLTGSKKNEALGLPSQSQGRGGREGGKLKAGVEKLSNFYFEDGSGSIIKFAIGTKEPS